MRILTVLGARPQFIKASVVSAALAGEKGVREVVVHTGQHFDANMSEVFFEELGMAPPDYHLGISGGGHGEMTGRMLIELEKTITAVAPDVVLVYGDTNSTLAGAVCAAKLHIPVAHVEAGLRSFNMRMPEEINRVLTDRLSRWLFAPTELAVRHLAREGVDSSIVENVGDVMFDVALQHGRRAMALGDGILDRLGLQPRSFALVTIHRAENTDVPERLAAIVDGLAGVATSLPVIWPLHPRTAGALRDLGLLDRAEKSMRLIEPQGYLDMVRLERSASVIATDSGGVQKEAFFHRVPCVTLRDETEWRELVDSGWNRLVSPSVGGEIAAAVLSQVGRSGADIAPYGNGDASARIAARVIQDVQR